MKAHASFILTFFTLWHWPAVAQNSVVSWQSFGGGFGRAALSNSVLVTDVGQSFVGGSAGNNSFIEAGFLTHHFLRGPLTGIDEHPDIPAAYSLSQNFPNPFNPSTTIRFELPRESRVELALYSILGQKVATLINEERGAAGHSIVWNGTGDTGLRVASGVYFYRIETRPLDGSSPFVSIRKMILLK